MARALQALGGAKVVMATVGAPAAMSAAVDGLRARGELVTIGVSPKNIEVSPLQLITGEKTLHGHASGTSQEVEETMRFAVQSGVRCISEQVPLQDAPQAYDNMMSGTVRYRGVLTPTSAALSMLIA
jgi:alcohol dehydrogenase